MWRYLNTAESIKTITPSQLCHIQRRAILTSDASILSKYYLRCSTEFSEPILLLFDTQSFERNHCVLLRPGLTLLLTSSRFQNLKSRTTSLTRKSAPVDEGEHRVKYSWISLNFSLMAWGSKVDFMRENWEFFFNPLFGVKSYASFYKPGIIHQKDNEFLSPTNVYTQACCKKPGILHKKGSDTLLYSPFCCIIPGYKFSSHFSWSRL